MNLIIYKRMDDYLKKLAASIGAKVNVSQDFVSLIKGNKIANIYLSKDNYNNARNSVLFLEKGTANGKYITFEMLDSVLASTNDITNKVFECWLFDEAYEKLIEIIFSNISKKDDKPRIINKEETYKIYSKIDEANIGNVISKSFDKDFIYNSKNKAFYASDNSVVCISLVSKNYNKTSYNYWYSYHPYQKKIFEQYKNGFLLLSFKDSKEVLALPSEFINERLKKLGSSCQGEKKYWHIHVKKKNDKYELRIPNVGLEDITECLLVKDKKKISDDDLVIDIRSMKSVTKNRY